MAATLIAWFDIVSSNRSSARRYPLSTTSTCRATSFALNSVGVMALMSTTWSQAMRVRSRQALFGLLTNCANSPSRVSVASSTWFVPDRWETLNRPLPPSGSSRR